jgi:hypothetical protein
MASLESTPTYDELTNALIQAHNAGETAHAEEISQIIKELYPDKRIEVTSQAEVQEIYRATEQTDDYQAAAQNITGMTLPTTQVMATLGEGQAVLQRPEDGKTYYVDQNARIFTDNEAVIQAAMTYEEGKVHPNEVYKQEQAREYFASEGETKVPFMTEGFRRQGQYHSGNILQGVLGGGSWLEEFMAKTMGQQRADEWVKTDEMGDIAYPWWGIGENLAGAIGSGVAIGATKYPQQFYQWVNKLPFVQKGFWSWLGGAGFGTAEGLLYGAGREEAEGTRYESAMKGGELGFYFGGAGNVAGQRLADFFTKMKVSPIEAFGFYKIKEGLKDTSIPEIQKMFGGISTNAAKIIKDVIATTGISFKEALANLRKGGSQSRIADIDIATEVLTDAVAAAGGESASIVQSAVLERGRATAQSLERGLDKNVAELPPMKEHPHLKQDPDEIAKLQAIETAPARKEAYDKAYSHKVDYKSAEGKEILEVLEAMPKKVKNAALQEVNDLLAMDGKEAYQIDWDFVLDAKGDWILTKMPQRLNMTQLDYIKRALSKIAYESEGVLKAGHMVPTYSALSLAALKQRFKLSEALKRMNTDYKAAVKLGQDKITRENALDVGFLVMTKQLSPQDLARALQGAGEAEKAMARMGLRASLDDLLNNIKGTVTRRDVDIKGMDMLWSQLSSKANRTKIQMILGTKEYKNMVKLLDKAEAAMAMRVAVNVNSKTAIRETVKGWIADTSDTARMAMQIGEGLQTTKKIIQNIMQTRKISDRHQAILMKELAEAMTDAKGAKTIALYRKLYKAVKNGQATDAEMVRISEIVIGRLNLAPLAATESLARARVDSQRE